MRARDKSRFTPKQAAWIAVGVFAAWLAFLLVPKPREEKAAASTELPPLAAESKLESVGLANNPDWQGLPGYFAVWVDSANWSDNRTYFAYWNPGSYSYTYFFEAKRGSDGIRFRSLAGWPGDTGFYFDEVKLARYAEARRADSPTHPFVFAEPARPLTLIGPAREGPKRPAAGSLEKVEIEPGAQPIAPPLVRLPASDDNARK